MKNNLLRTGLSVMSMTFQSWLNFQETQYAKEGKTVNDDTHFRTPATYPTRGVLKAWIATLDKAQFTLQMHTVDQVCEIANDLDVPLRLSRHEITAFNKGVDALQQAIRDKFMP